METGFQHLRPSDSTDSEKNSTASWLNVILTGQREAVAELSWLTDFVRKSGIEGLPNNLGAAELSNRFRLSGRLAERLHAVIQLVHSTHRGQTLTDTTLESILSELRVSKVEQIRVVFQDDHDNITGSCIAGIGSKTRVDANLSDLLRRALESHATKLIVIHNHPSGKLEPSAEDIESTNRLRVTAEFVGLKVSDHLIVAPDGKTRAIFS
jgi:hypothetical protein